MKFDLRTDLHRAQRSVTYFGALLAIALGFALKLQLTAAPPQRSRKWKPAPVRIISEEPQVTRSIASAVRYDPHTADIKLSCGQQNDKVVNLQIADGVERIRVLGKLCAASPEGHQSLVESISNKANQFSATIFYPRDGEFISDYITLEPSDNTLSLTSRTSSGEERETQLLLNRKPSSLE